ncbi:hypothetical protein OIY81_2944 [Cryptosporidium canis]|nr:hypothetical protein OIY81_2944 [Cryptosporidium canis]
MNLESKTDQEFALKDSNIEPECFIPALSPREAGSVFGEDGHFPAEMAPNQLTACRDKTMHNFDQVQSFSRPNIEPTNPQYLYLTTTASSSDQIIDHTAPAFPIEDFKKSKAEPGLESIGVQASDDGLTSNPFKIEKFNSVIKEDKEKRKVIVEWINNNEWSCKQWSCKKFGKEGAAKRAIQFLEKIHGTTISCLPEGFYSTLLHIGSIEGSKSTYSRRKSTGLSERSVARKRSKSTANMESKTEDLFLEPLGGSLSVGGHSLQEKHDPQTVHLIQKIMFLLSPLEPDSLETKQVAKSSVSESRSGEPLGHEKLHSNCRRQLRSLVLENVKSKRFVLDEYRSVLSRAAHVPDLEFPEDGHDQLVHRDVFDALLGVKTVRDILNKTVRSDLKLLYAAKDIMQIIRLGGEESTCIQAEDGLAHWDRLIESGSRISDDLQYLSEGGLPGYSAVACSSYGSGFFQFSSQHGQGLHSAVNHRRSCMNPVHIDIQDHGYKSLYTSLHERRRIATRLQGKTQSHESCELSPNLSSKLLEGRSAPVDRAILEEGHHSGTAGGASNCMQMSSGVYTMLDIKYGVKGGQSKRILSDTLAGHRVGYDSGVDTSASGGSSGHGSVSCAALDYQGCELDSRTVRKRRSAHESGNSIKVQRLSHERPELQKSKIEWWKKPRGWKVTYYREGQKCSQIFRVSLNSSCIERESQYKLAYSFYLSTQQDVKEEVGLNSENSHTISYNSLVNHEMGAESVVMPPLSLNGIPNLLNTVNLMQMFNANPNSRGILPSNVPVVGNIIPFNYCLPALFGGCSPLLFGVGLNNSAAVQGDEGLSHPGVENHAGGCSSTQKPYQAYTTLIQPVNPFIMPVFPPILQNPGLSQHPGPAMSNMSWLGCPNSGQVLQTSSEMASNAAK